MPQRYLLTCRAGSSSPNSRDQPKEIQNRKNFPLPAGYFRVQSLISTALEHHKRGNQGQHLGAPMIRSMMRLSATWSMDLAGVSISGRRRFRTLRQE